MSLEAFWRELELVLPLLVVITWAVSCCTNPLAPPRVQIPSLAVSTVFVPLCESAAFYQLCHKSNLRFADSNWIQSAAFYQLCHKSNLRFANSNWIQLLSAKRNSREFLTVAARLPFVLPASWCATAASFPPMTSRAAPPTCVFVFHHSWKKMFLWKVFKLYKT